LIQAFRALLVSLALLVPLVPRPAAEAPVEEIATERAMPAIVSLAAPVEEPVEPDLLGEHRLLGDALRPTPEPTPVMGATPTWLVLRWLPVLQVVASRSGDELRLDPALVLAMIFSESGGDGAVGTSHANAMGLMQVIPRSWTASAKCLEDPICNVYAGERILRSTMDKHDGDLRLALALYNCSEEGVRTDGCGSTGGYHYADAILNVYRPHFAAELSRLVAGRSEWQSRIESSARWPEMLEWLRSWEYGPEAVKEESDAR